MVFVVIVAVIILFGIKIKLTEKIHNTKTDQKAKDSVYHISMSLYLHSHPIDV